MWIQGNYGNAIEVTLEQAKAASHQGNCDADVLELSKVPKIARQLKGLNPDILRDELKQYGAWSDEELQDHEQNLQRWLWLGCGQVVEEQFEKESR